MNLSDDDGFHIRIDQILRYFEVFAENIEDAIAPDKSNQNDIAIGDIRTDRNFCISPQFQDRQLRIANHLHRGFALQATVAVMLVMKRLKIFALPL